MMDPRVPDEIEMKELIEVIPLGVLPQPGIRLFSVKCLQNLTRTVLLTVVSGDQVARAFRDLKPRLQSHGPLGQRANQSFKEELCPVAFLVAGVVGRNAAHSISGD